MLVKDSLGRVGRGRTERGTSGAGQKRSGIRKAIAWVDMSLKFIGYGTVSVDVWNSVRKEKRGEGNGTTKYGGYCFMIKVCD